jgi:competence protein ComEC
MANSVVIPYIKNKSIPIDILLVSSKDRDHSGGIYDVLEKLKINNILVNHTIKEKYKHIQKPCLEGQKWIWDNVEFEILSPNKNEIKKWKKRNNISCVLQVKSKYGSVLLPADVERKAEKKLINTFGSSLKSTILVSPHHGSKTSSSYDFISLINPKYIAISSGFLNRYHHPHNKTIAVYKSINKNIQIYNTSKNGAIEFYIAKKGVLVKTYSEKNKIFYIDDQR